MLLIKVILLIWYSNKKTIFRKIKLIFVIEVFKRLQKISRIPKNSQEFQKIPKKKEKNIKGENKNLDELEEKMF